MVLIQFKRNGNVIKEKNISEEKAQKLKLNYKKEHEVKEFFKLSEQILITIGGAVLGYFALDIANRISSEIEKDD